MARVILGLLVSALLASQALAQASPSPVDHWDSGLLLDTLRGLGASGAQVSATGGRPVITAVTREGLAATLLAKGCDNPEPATGPSCHAIEIIFTFDVSQRPDRAALADQLNHGYALGKFTVEPDGSLRASRYLLLDGGISQDNLRQELIDIFTVADLTRRTLSAPAPH
jgi:hypothetical protein